MDPFLNIQKISSLTAFEFEAACRRFTHYASLGDNIALCRILTCYKIYVDTRDTSVSPHIIMDGFWESWLSQTLAKLIKPGDICIDIGANFGYYSVLMSALAGTKGQTVAIEPNPHLCRLLRLTAGVNGPGFGVAEVALSNTTGKIPLHIPESSFGDASILQRTDRPIQKSKKVKVEVIRFDELAKRMNLEKVNVIKMDVEGLEPLVFEGMQETIENNPGLKLFIEYSPFLYSNPQQFTKYLFSRFQVHRIRDIENMELLDESAIEELVSLKSHHDLYLVRK